MKPPRVRSMQARLTLLLGVISLLVSSLAGATLFWALKREVERQEITEVSGKLELINHLIDMQNNARGLHDLAATFDDMRTGQSQLGIWIVDAQGHPVYGGDAPETLQTLPDRQVLLQLADGSRMRGLRVAVDDRATPRRAFTTAWVDHPTARLAPQRHPNRGARPRAAPPTAHAVPHDCRSVAAHIGHRRDASAPCAPCCRPGTPKPRVGVALSHQRL